MLHYFYIFECVHCEITSLWVAFKLFKIKNGFSAKRRSKQIGPWNEFFALLPKYKTTFPVIRADARPVYYSIDFGSIGAVQFSLWDYLMIGSVASTRTKDKVRRNNLENGQHTTALSFPNRLQWVAAAGKYLHIALNFFWKMVQFKIVLLWSHSVRMFFQK